MPHVPGNPAEGHGQIFSEGGQGLPPGGRIYSEWTGGRLLNQSGISFNLPKFLNMPQGWNETDGYKEHFRHDDTQCERVFTGPWGLRPQFIAWALGYSYSIPDPQNPELGILKREVPINDPEFPWLYAVDYELARADGAWLLRNDLFVEVGEPPVLVPAPKIGYQGRGPVRDTHCATVKIIFRHLTWEVRTDEETDSLGKGELSRNIYREPTYSTEAISFPTNARPRFLEGPPGVQGEFVPENVGRLLVPKNSWRYHWMDVPDLPVAGFRECVGKVNLEAFDGARGGQLFAPETLLCMAPVPVRYRTATGRVSHKVTYLFLESPTEKGWNAFPALGPAGLGEYYRVGWDQNNGVFKTADFANLFKVPTPVNYQ